MTDAYPSTWRAPTQAQRVAARIAGAILITAMATAMFAELYLLRGLASADPAAMARNILNAEVAYRTGALIHLLTFASDAAVAAALFVVLAPVDRGLALLGALWRAVDCAILVVSMLFPFAILRLVKGVGALAALPSDEVMAWVQWLYSLQADAMRFGWIFLGLGSAAFAVAWLRSRYVPRILAAWGIFASLLLAAGPAAHLISPGLVPAWAYMAPMFFYEVPLGLWLLARGVRGEQPR